MGKKLQITAIGDGCVGKTSLLIRFVNKTFSDETMPTILDEYHTMHSHKGMHYELTLNDTAGQENFEQIRSLQYNKTDIFLMCFALNERTTFDNLLQKWAPDVKSIRSKVPVVLVGTKFDLDAQVTAAEIEKMKKKLKIDTYVSCSAKTGQNIRDVFEFAVSTYIEFEENTKKRCLRCVLS